MFGQPSLARRPSGAQRPFFEIAAVIVIKLLLLVALSQLFFSSARHPPPSAEDVSSHLFAKPN